ncbi:hypothetical protein R6Q57_025128 [Mikania cordata]
MECIEVITTKDSIQSLETCSEMIFALTHSHRLKVFDSSRKMKDVFKNKNVTCIKASIGKLYIGCVDSSIQELIIGNNRQQEIKAPSKSWKLQNKPINSIALYKDWLYNASTSIDGSRIKELRKQSKPQVSIIPEKRTNVVAMSIVEDFMYLNTSCSTSYLEQIWLRGTHHKVGRLSASNKITSILAANDMILCGTESGLIKTSSIDMQHYVMVCYAQHINNLTMKSINLISVLIVVVVATQAKAKLINVININAYVSCSLNASVEVNGTTPTLPPFPYALTKVVYNGIVRGTGITNEKGELDIVLSPILVDLNTLLSSCRLVVVTPLSTCNPTLPSARRALQAPLQLAGNFIFLLLNITNLMAGPFVSIVI